MKLNKFIINQLMKRGEKEIEKLEAKEAAGTLTEQEQKALSIARSITPEMIRNMLEGRNGTS